jgi:dihydropteroate synthase
MQNRPRYRNVVQDVADFLAQAAGRARRAGIAASRILIDPGFGFGKTVAHNLSLMKHLDTLVRLGYPVVVGPSRKSFIGKTVDAAIGQREPGTLACVSQAWLQGAAVVRVHDVAASRQFLRMAQSMQAAS